MKVLATLLGLFGTPSGSAPGTLCPLDPLVTALGPWPPWPVAVYAYVHGVKLVS